MRSGACSAAARLRAASVSVERPQPAAIERRAFSLTLSLAGAALLAAPRRALAQWGPPPGSPAGPPPRILLNSNENPVGPGAAVVEAVRAGLLDGEPAGRYPWKRAEDLARAIAERFSARPENVALGCGSTQVLTSAVQVFTSPSRALVSGHPSYGECASYAERIGTPVRMVPLDSKLRLDLDAMAEASKGAGLVFLDNPNNPTGTLWPADAVTAFVEKVMAGSKDALVLIDEAYHDYVTDPSHRSQAPLALRNPRLVVARTFSKAHGMAGLRLGYGLGHPDTIKKLSSWESYGFLNVPAILAGVASIRDQQRLLQERDRNTEARRFTLDWFAQRGYSAAEAHGNFVFVDVRRPAREFREGCRKEGVLVARDFRPFEKTHARISIGTLAEMKEAVQVFEKVLAVAPAKAA